VQWPNLLESKAPRTPPRHATDLLYILEHLVLVSVTTEMNVQTIDINAYNINQNGNIAH
jgi:hypothetical protein